MMEQQATPVAQPDPAGTTAAFSLRVVDADYYMAEPVENLDVCESDIRSKQAVIRVPVMRVFGSTPSGQRACLHLHRLYPYVYVVLPPTWLNMDNTNFKCTVTKFTVDLEQSIEKSLNHASAAAGSAAPGGAPPAILDSAPTRRREHRQHVEGVKLVRARGFYGYQTGDEVFMKITLFNPAMMGRVAKLLLAAGFQPHESHISYLMQVFIDHNLRGMSHLNLGQVRCFRKLPESPQHSPAALTQLRMYPRESVTIRYDDQEAPYAPRCTPDATTVQPRVWTKRTFMDARQSLGWDVVSPPAAVSTCELELDCIASDIMNGNDVQVAPLDSAPADMQLVQSLAGIWMAERERTGGAVPEPKPSPVRRRPEPSDEERRLRELVVEAMHLEKQNDTGRLMVDDPDDPDADRSARRLSDNPSQGDVSQASQGCSQWLLECSQPANEVAAHSQGSQLDVRMLGSEATLLAHGDSPPLTAAVSMFDSPLEKDDSLDHLAPAPPTQAQVMGNVTQLLERYVAETPLKHATEESSAGTPPLAVRLSFSAEDVECISSRSQLPAELDTHASDDDESGDGDAQREWADIVDEQDDAPLRSTRTEPPRETSSTSALPSESGPARSAHASVPLMLHSGTVAEQPRPLQAAALAQQPQPRRPPHLSPQLRPLLSREQSESIKRCFRCREDLHGVKRSKDPTKGYSCMRGEGCRREESMHAVPSTIQPAPVAGQSTQSSIQYVYDVCTHPQQETCKYVDDEMDLSDGELARMPAKHQSSKSPSPVTPPTQPFSGPRGTLGASLVEFPHPSATPSTPVMPGESTPETPVIYEQKHWTLAGSPVHPTARLSESPHHHPFDVETSRAAAIASPSLFDNDEGQEDDHPSQYQFQNTQDFVEQEDAVGEIDWNDMATDEHPAAAAALPSPTAHSTVNVFRCHRLPPTAEQLEATAHALGVENPVVFYSNPADVPAQPFVRAGRQMLVLTQRVRDLPRHVYSCTAFSKLPTMKNDAHQETRIGTSSLWVAARPPPSRHAVEQWCRDVGYLPSTCIAACARAGTLEEPQKDGFQASRGGGGSSERRQSLAVSTASQQSWGQDANTGKLVIHCEKRRRRPWDDPGDLSPSDEESDDEKDTHTKEEPVRAQSPKYDESYLLNLRFHQLDTLPEDGASSQAAAAHPHSPGISGTLPKPPLRDASHTGSQVDCTPPAHLLLPRPPKSPASARRHTPSSVSKVPRSFQVCPTKGFSPAGKADFSQITGDTPTDTSTPLSQAGFAVGDAKSQQLVIMSIEVHADSQGPLLSNPSKDAVRTVVLALHDDTVDPAGEAGVVFILTCDRPEPAAASADPLSPPAAAAAAVPMETDGACASAGKKHPLGALSERQETKWRVQKWLQMYGCHFSDSPGCVRLHVPSEELLLLAFVAAVIETDPDMLTGYEVQNKGLGYVKDRATSAYDMNLMRVISRVPKHMSRFETMDDQYGRDHTSDLHVVGRVVLNLWRMMRDELKLQSYRFENVIAAVLRERIPHIPQGQLHVWFCSVHSRPRCVGHYVLRARLNLRLLEHLDLVKRTAEMARIFGIPFHDVILRGSQFRVESMLLRLAHTQNYIMVSPSPEQVARQRATEVQPLVMNPQSEYYTDPVVVLDFQSLYPSMIIAYNLCYTTCLGRVPSSGMKACGERPLGFLKLDVPTGTVEAAGGAGLREDINSWDNLLVTPNGVLFAPPNVRKGVLPRMLSEILETRVMVKTSMKRAGPSQRNLQRTLNASQFALKLLANVTYGYTAANFSGRMPCTELADAIVALGRHTLERAIKQIEAGWPGVKVVYGDTDSLFVKMPGRTKEDAFRMGAEMAAAVTEVNPTPVALKMEKVYTRCLLVTKKRYVGWSFESPSQSKAIFDAKGIETVRRDSCPVVAKTMEQAVRLLFRSDDLSRVKRYLRRQWRKILSGRVSIQDFIFCKEVRLGTYSGCPPPAAIVAGKALMKDPRTTPQYAERVPYVVVCGQPGAILRELVMSPHEVVQDPRRRLHFGYYLNKQINPSLQRLLALAGADVEQWFRDMEKPRERAAKRGDGADDLKSTGQPTLSQYFLSQHCAVCDELTQRKGLHGRRFYSLCDDCEQDPQTAAAVLQARNSHLETQRQHLLAICLQCGGGGAARGEPGGMARTTCDSLDCSVFFEQRKLDRELAYSTGQATECLRALENRWEDVGDA